MSTVSPQLLDFLLKNPDMIGIKTFLFIKKSETKLISDLYKILYSKFWSHQKIKSLELQAQKKVKRDEKVNTYRKSTILHVDSVYDLDRNFGNVLSRAHQNWDQTFIHL